MNTPPEANTIVIPPDERFLLKDLSVPPNNKFETFEHMFMHTVHRTIVAVSNESKEKMAETFFARNPQARQDNYVTMTNPHLVAASVKNLREQ